MSDAMKLFLLAAVVMGVLWASAAFAQKDRMHIGESLGGRVIRATGASTTKPDDPDPLHSQAGSKAVTGELKPQRLPTFHNPHRDIQTK